MSTRPSWFVAAALVGLGQHCAARHSEPFSAGELVTWVAAFDRPANALLAIKALVMHRYLVAAEPTAPRGTTRPVDRWRLTSEGAIAARSALQSDRALPARAYGPMVTNVDPFVGRLWSLLRIRKVLTADEAACVLVDAGDDVASARRKCGALLLAWSRRCPQAVRLGARRVDGGQKRYVLAVDIGPVPPALTKGATTP